MRKVVLVPSLQSTRKHRQPTRTLHKFQDVNLPTKVSTSRNLRHPEKSWRAWPPPKYTEHRLQRTQGATTTDEKHSNVHTRISQRCNERTSIFLLRPHRNHQHPKPGYLLAARSWINGQRILVKSRFRDIENQKSVESSKQSQQPKHWNLHPSTENHDSIFVDLGSLLRKLHQTFSFKTPSMKSPRFLLTSTFFEPKFSYYENYFPNFFQL